jgi:Na+-translocating ferredoxin:NAD+ oxidoreductase subunit G
MAKLESSFKNMLVSLFGATLIASASLGLVNDATREAIIKTEQNKQTSAIAAVLPSFASLGEPYKRMPSDGKDSITIFPALNEQGKIMGYAVKSYTYNGFSGYIEVMTGFNADGSIAGYQVLKHAETPGLGSKMNDWFRPQTKVSKSVIEKIFGFEVKAVERQSSVIEKHPGNNKLAVSKDDGEIDAITAATISSRAFLDAINRAYAVLDFTADVNQSSTNQKGE